jgi:hypothetical protein
MSWTPHPTTARTAELLALVDEGVTEGRRVEARRAENVLAWVEAHALDSANREQARLLASPGVGALGLGAAGVLVEPFCDTELAVALRVHPLAARALMCDVVDLAHRLPRTWSTLLAGHLELWVARRIATVTRPLDARGADQVDAALAPGLATLPTGRLLDLAAARTVEADPEAADARAAERRTRQGAWLTRPDGAGEHGLQTMVARGPVQVVRQTWATLDHLAHLLAEHGRPDPEDPPTLEQLRGEALGLLGNPLAALKLMVGAGEHDHPEIVAAAIRDAPPASTRPRAVAYVHLSPGLLEDADDAGQGTASRVARAEDLGALTRAQLVALLGHHQVSLRPVIDLADDVAADCYEVPAPVAERVHLVRPADVFPHVGGRSRATDLDHAEPYRPHGPPGQTRISNLAHLGRTAHRTKTHHPGWRLRLDDGRAVWTTPHGYVLVTDGRGTHRVGSPRTTGADTTSAGERRVLDLVWQHAA